MHETLKDLRIALLTGGDSPEKEVSYATAKSVAASLERLSLDYVRIEASGDYLSVLKEEGVELVFIAMHGGSGENGIVQASLEYAGIKYTGSGHMSSALCMNKDASKQIFEYNAILTPEWQLLSDSKDLHLELPIVIKPVEGGSTIGTFIIRSHSGLDRAIDDAVSASKDSIRFRDRVMAEKYIPGRELTVGILDGKAFPILEISSMTEFYDYEAKYTEDMSKHLHLENVEPSLYKSIQKTALRAYDSLYCSSMARVDFRLNEERVYVLEVNTIPGMTEMSLLPEAAELDGISFDELVLRILESGIEKKNS